MHNDCSKIYRDDNFKYEHPQVQGPNFSKFQPWTNPGPPYSEQLTAPKFSAEEYSEELTAPVASESQVAQDRSSGWEANWNAPR